ncbi:MAG: hypothetical protein VKJ04_05330 [Vampirovibrionales bacterium]|nr:hypothetical protein [Vampirovibrionales bacterium]
MISPWTRDGIIRYWAYVNDFTAAFRPIIGPTGVLIGQGLSYFYSILDTYVVGKRVNEINKNQPVSARRKHVAAHALDAGIFQVFASVLIPFILIDGLRIKRLQMPGIREGFELAIKALGRRGVATFNQPKIQRYLPIALSLATIPVTAPIVDKSFHWLMNQTIRDWMDLPKLYHKKRAEQNIRAQVKDAFDAFEW